MSRAKAKIWAKKFYRGEKTVEDFEELSKEDQELVKEAYEEIYGDEMPV